MRNEILQARKISRNELLDKEKSQGNVSKLTFNVTYYPVFRHLKSQLKELHVILACDEDHKKVFPEVPNFFFFFFFFFFNCYLADPRPTLGHSQGDSLTNPMLIAAFYLIRLEGHREPRNEVGSLSPAERLAGFEPGTFRF